VGAGLSYFHQPTRNPFEWSAINVTSLHLYETRALTDLVSGYAGSLTHFDCRRTAVEPSHRG